jgi:[FeFe] hydrogenase H-cluster maturation GTPase HydF
VIRNLLDYGMTAIVVRDDAYENMLSSLPEKPSIVICDSQVFGKVAKLTPKDIPLTSFSILMARAKGFLDVAVSGAQKISSLKTGDKVLICEGCTHHRQCEDIGTVKIPSWIKEHTGEEPMFEFTSGTYFPEDLSPYSLIIHCGGCMISEKEVRRRMRCALDEGVPFTNYGTSIAYIKGILDRSTEIFGLGM